MSCEKPKINAMISYVMGFFFFFFKPDYSVFLNLTRLWILTEKFRLIRSLCCNFT